MDTKRHAMNTYLFGIKTIESDFQIGKEMLTDLKKRAPHEELVD